MTAPGGVSMAEVLVAPSRLPGLPPPPPPPSLSESPLEHLNCFPGCDR